MSAQDIAAYSASLRRGLRHEEAFAAFKAAQAELKALGATDAHAANGARWVIDVMRRRVGDKLPPLSPPCETPEKAAAFWFNNIRGEL